MELWVTRLEYPQVCPLWSDVVKGNVASVIEYYAHIADSILPDHPYYKYFHPKIQFSSEYSLRLVINKLAGGTIEWNQMDESERGKWRAVCTLENMVELIRYYEDHNDARNDTKSRVSPKKGSRR
jgi:hypothetical protein